MIRTRRVVCEATDRWVVRGGEEDWQCENTPTHEIGVLHRRYIGEGSRFYRVTAKSVDAYLDSLSEVKGA